VLAVVIIGKRGTVKRTLLEEKGKGE